MLRRLSRRLTPDIWDSCTPPSPAESVSFSSSELQQAFASGAEAAMVMPPPARSSRMSRTSERSVASSLAMEIFGFSRDMSGNLMQVVGQVQTQAEAQRLDALAQRDEAKRREEAQREEICAQRAEVKQREEAQRAEAKQTKEAQQAEAKRREEAQRAEAMKREELALTREQMLIQIKTVTDQTSADREKAQIEANQKREQALRKEKAEADEATRKREQPFMARAEETENVSGCQHNPAAGKTEDG